MSNLNYKILNLKLLYSLVILLVIGVLIMYVYLFNISWFFLSKILSISFFFLFTLFYLDDFKLSDNKSIKYSQIVVFVLFVFYKIYFIFYILLNYDFFYDIVCNIKPDDIKDAKENNNVTLKGKVVLDEKAGAELAKSLHSVGSNIGLGACVGSLAAGVSKTLVKSSLPPVQKVGLVAASGMLGAIIHTGASAINAQTHMANNNVKAKELPKELPKNVNSLLESSDNTSPLEILLKCINILDAISIWLIIIIFIQFFFKFYITDKPKLLIIDYLLPSYSNKLKTYIYKLIRVYKNMSNVYIIIALVLLLISFLASTYFALELHNNIDSYVDVYIQLKK